MNSRYVNLKTYAYGIELNIILSIVNKRAQMKSYSSPKIYKLANIYKRATTVLTQISMTILIMTRSNKWHYVFELILNILIIIILT